MRRVFHAPARCAQWFILLLVFFGICAGGIYFSANTGADDDIRLTAKVNKSVVTIGTKITYTVSVDYREPILLLSDIPTDQLSAFTIRKENPQVVQKEEDGRVQVTKKVVIVPYELGDITIPSFAIPYKKNAAATGTKQIMSDPLTVTVQSVARPSDVDDIRPIKGVYDFIERVSKIARSVGITVLGLLCAIFLIYRILKRRTQSAGPARKETPYEYALRQLKELAQANLIRKGAIHLFADGLSDILRSYVSTEYGRDIMDKTTGELMTEMTSFPFTETTVQNFLRILAECDIMKFARFIPSDERLRTLFEETKETVQAIHAHYEAVRAREAEKDSG